MLAYRWNRYGSSDGSTTSINSLRVESHASSGDPLQLGQDCEARVAVCFYALDIPRIEPMFIECIR
jgi:hypothetical protein